jgi:WD40 repeat protein
VAGSIDRWDPVTGRPLERFPARPVGGLAAVSSDGRLLAAGDGCRVRVWELASGKETGVTDEAHEGWPLSLDVAAGLVATGNMDGTVRLWEAAIGRQRLNLRLDRCPLTVALSPDGTRFAGYCWDHAIRVWDAGTGRELRRLAVTGTKDASPPLGFTPDGRRLLSLDSDVRLPGVGRGER